MTNTANTALSPFNEPSRFRLTRAPPAAAARPALSSSSSPPPSRARPWCPAATAATAALPPRPRPLLLCRRRHLLGGGASSASPSANRSTPAHATITPLSVHHRGGGSTSGKPRLLRRPRRASRERSRSRATPPRDDDARLRAFPPDGSACVSPTPLAILSGGPRARARRVRSSRCFTAAAWNDAAMSARIHRASPRAVSSAVHRLRGPGLQRPRPPCSKPPHARERRPRPSPPQVAARGEPHGGLEPGVGEVAVLALAQGHGEPVRLRVPAPRSASSAGPPPPPTSKPRSLGGLVVRLAERVVQRAAETRYSPTARARISWLCPPDTSSARNGNGARERARRRRRRVAASRVGPRFVRPPRLASERACASMWCTGTMGSPCSSHRSCALTTPTRRHMDSPGPTVTATAERFSGETPRAASARARVVDGVSCASRAVGHDAPHARVDRLPRRERLAEHAPVARDHGGAGVVAAGLDAEDHGARAHGTRPRASRRDSSSAREPNLEPGAAVGRVRRGGAHDGRRGADATPGRARGEAPGRRPARACARRPRVRVAARADDVSAGRRGGGDFSRDRRSRVTPRVRGERHARARRERAHRPGATRSI